MKQADIYVNDIFCGILTEDEEGFHFAYDKSYLDRENAAPVSPTMPLTEQQYDKEMMFPVFDGLIPRLLCWTYSGIGRWFCSLGLQGIPTCTVRTSL
jgi:hypothetical protein